MKIAKSYTLAEFLDWTRRKTYILLVLATVPATLYQVFGLTWITAPWSVAGITAVSCVEFTNVVTRSRPSRRTMEHVEKPVPFTVIENWGSPTERTFGEIFVVTGADLFCATTKWLALELCAFVITICTSLALIRVCDVAPLPAMASTLVPSRFSAS